MARWRLLTLILIVLALALWGLVFGLNLRPELAAGIPRNFVPPGSTLRLQAPLSGLPPWVPSLELFITLFLAGIANLYLFPDRVRKMVSAVSPNWRRIFPVMLLGIGFGLLLVVFAIGAALARITFPFTILSALALLFLSVWGFLAVAYLLGRLLLTKAGWGAISPIFDLGLGLLLLLPLMRIPLAGSIVMIVYIGLGLGLVITTRFGSDQPWSLISLLEEENE